MHQISRLARRGLTFLAVVTLISSLSPALVTAQIDEREVQLARQRYRFEFLAARPSVTGLKGDLAQVLYIGARVKNNGAEPALARITVLVDVRFENRERVTERAHISVEGIEPRKPGVVYFPLPLKGDFDTNNLPEIKSVSLQVETSLSPNDKEQLVEFGAEPTEGFFLASVDTEYANAEIFHVIGREVYPGGRRGRIVRDKVLLWTTAGTPAAVAALEVQHGEPVRLIKKTKDWYYVRTFQGKEGWAPAMLIDIEPDFKTRPTAIKERNYGTFRLVEYSILPSQDGGTIIEGRMLNDTAIFYYLTGFEVNLQDEKGRKIGEGRAVIKDFGRKEIAPFAVVFSGLPTHRVARARFRLKDAERRIDTIIINNVNGGNQLNVSPLRASSKDENQESGSDETTKELVLVR
ncbi:MAG: SH3 domain-containing protein [Planctomycetota bacterium]|nr:SH3 domain-containing protein [Planctomycetota bacterium]